VGESGEVVGADLTPGMLAQARRVGRGELAWLIVADVLRLPFRNGQFDVVLAAGIIPHLQDPQAGLAEIARVTRAGGVLAVFHPIGRAALAARHGGTPSEDDALASGRLSRMLAASGWSLQTVDDGLDRYLAVSVREDTV
jgi:SAM-dependent methyltransferase